MTIDVFLFCLSRDNWLWCTAMRMAVRMPLSSVVVHGCAQLQQDVSWMGCQWKKRGRRQRGAFLNDQRVYGDHAFSS